MKNLWFSGLVLAFFALAACNNADAGLVKEMQDTLTQVETEAPDFETAHKSAAALHSAVEGIAADTSAAFGEISQRAGMLVTKVEAMQTTYADLQARLNTLIAEYKDGKIETEAARTEMKQIQENIAGLRANMPEVSEMISRYEAEFGRLSAESKAQSEQ